MNWKQKMKDVKELTSKLKTKVDTKLEKEKIKMANRKIDEIKSIDARLAELKNDEKTQRKREQIAKLEKKLTASGKVFTALESGLKMIQKQSRKRATKKPRKTSKTKR